MRNIKSEPIDNAQCEPRYPDPNNRFTVKVYERSKL